MVSFPGWSLGTRKAGAFGWALNFRCTLSLCGPGKYRSRREFPDLADKTADLPTFANAVSNSEAVDFQALFRVCVGLLTQEPNRALTEMFDLTAQRLVRFAATITGNQPDAEDALQGAFSRIAFKPRLLAKADAPWPYLIRSVRNEALRIIQKRRGTGAETAERRSVEESAEAQIVHEETADSVRRILKSLPKSQYEVVILKHWEELTFAEIAEALDLSQNTVASRYRYAMEKLQRSLEPLMK